MTNKRCKQCGQAITRENSRRRKCYACITDNAKTILHKVYNDFGKGWTCGVECLGCGEKYIVWKIYFNNCTSCKSEYFKIDE